MKIIFCILFFYTSILGFSQEIVSYKELTNQLSKDLFRGVIGQDKEGNTFILRNSGPPNTGGTIEKYNSSFELVSSNLTGNSFGVMGASYLHRSIAMDHGSIYHFYEGWNKSDKKNSYIIYSSDANGVMTGDGFVLETEPGKNQMKSADYSYKFSPDGKILAVLTEKPFAKGEKEKVRVQLFSTDDFKSLWFQDVTFDNESKRNPKNQFIVNNEGVIGILKDIKVSQMERAYQWISITENGHLIEPLDLGKNFLTYNKMLVNGYDEFVVISMAVKASNSWVPWQNILFLKANSIGKTEVVSIEPLGNDIYKLLYPDKEMNEQETFNLNNFVLKDVVLTENNSVYLITEHQKTTKVAVGPPENKVFNYTINYSGIIVIAFDEKGDRVWNTLYDKRQSEVTQNQKSTYGSFALGVKGNDLYFVWNYTAFKRDPRSGYRYWVDLNGGKTNLDNLYGKEALYPTLLTHIGADGAIQNSEKLFSSIVLKDIQEPNAYNMAIDPRVFLSTDSGFIILSRMPTLAAKRYKFSTITFK